MHHPETTAAVVRAGFDELRTERTARRSRRRKPAATTETTDREGQPFIATPSRQ